MGQWFCLKTVCFLEIGMLTHMVQWVAQTKAMSSCNCAGLNWDGACYAGLNVNIGMAVDCISLRAVHLQPIAAWMHFHFSFEFYTTYLTHMTCYNFSF